MLVGILLTGVIITGINHRKRRRIAATEEARELSDDTSATTPRCEGAPVTPLPAQFQYNYGEGSSRQRAATRPTAIPSPLSPRQSPTGSMYPSTNSLRIQEFSPPAGAGTFSSSHAMSMRNLLVPEDREQPTTGTQYTSRPAPMLASLSAPHVLQGPSSGPSSIQLPSISILAPPEETPPYFLSSTSTPQIPSNDQQILQAFQHHIVRPSTSEPTTSTTSDRLADRRTDNSIQSGFPRRM